MRKKKVLTETWLMLKKFVVHGTTVASWSPSSTHVMKAMMQDIDWDNAQCIVELGAGTGPITEGLVQFAKSHTKLVIIEQDADFCRLLREKFPQHDIVEGDACKLDEILAERGISHVDHVISGLPLPSFPKALRDEVIRQSAKVLNSKGDFRQLTNMPWVYRGLYKQYFRNVAFRFVPWNFPPAGVYYCRDFAG